MKKGAWHSFNTTPLGHGTKPSGTCRSYNHNSYSSAESYRFYIFRLVNSTQRHRKTSVEQKATGRDIQLPIPKHSEMHPFLSFVRASKVRSRPRWIFPLSGEAVRKGRYTCALRFVLAGDRLCSCGFGGNFFFFLFFFFFFFFGILLHRKIPQAFFIIISFLFFPLFPSLNFFFFVWLCSRVV